ncbi:ubiquitin-conjugating enzyme [Sodiomyces alkalinus F11]|uniref:Ubiquitin-conjugating enzyme E2 2 n=1 Tax=Sodiomyces alkalinus (strain CBS 110278 / VKM F-3762 / F11) TaxID=1314773 RepID=A0A3N2Q1Y2_SODAK|nr:ubiquitin-conjugating enzyme [Sodiomyces alkalinus F11]ROT40771.1 ubiquitin-conjugating enzyme [Sodiomyces alkalinus F11]
MASSAPSRATLLLTRYFKDITKGEAARDLAGVSCGLVNDNVFEWEVMLMIDDDTKHYGGAFFRARLVFPPNFPDQPPSMTFKNPIPFHPNIYPDGRLCISILHPPGEDEFGYEDPSERWNPARSPETILVSVLSLFHSPNPESSANFEAGRLLRDDPREFRKRVRVCVRESQENAGEA